MTPPLLFMWMYIAGFIVCSLYTLGINLVNKSVSELNKKDVLRDSFIIGIIWPVITFYILLDMYLTNKERRKRST